MIEDCEKFLNTIKNLEPYLMEFEEDELMKIKHYLNDYVIKRYVRRPIIVITNNKCMFSINNRI